jgi:hypothetical protein
MSEAKIRLSQKEMELITNADWILTKNAILQKINELLGSLLEKQQRYLETNLIRLPAELFKTSPKISKGENYKGLPYLILDYPRYFDQENICAIRTMFWWGNFFSITLHLSGMYKKRAEQKIISSYEVLKKDGCYCCVNDNQWEHHFESSNYKPLTEISPTGFKESISNNHFIKLANKISLQSLENAEDILLSFFKEMTGLVVA